MSYHEEQESIDELKAWWATWGNSITWGVLAVLIVGAAWNGWHYWQRRQTTQAAAHYEQLQQAVQAHDQALVARAAGDIEKDYGRTPYAQMAALLAAKAFYDAGDEKGAKAQLQWIVDHGRDDAYQATARIRLAGLLLDEKAYDAGLALLASAPAAPFKGLFEDRRGDLLSAQGKRDAARESYRNALLSLATADASERQLIQFKLDALGG